MVALAWLMLALPVMAALVLAAPRSERIGASVTIACAVVSFALSIAVIVSVEGGGILVLVPHWLENRFAFGALAAAGDVRLLHSGNILLRLRRSKLRRRPNAPLLRKTLICSYSRC